MFKKSWTFAVICCLVLALAGCAKKKEEDLKIVTNQEQETQTPAPAPSPAEIAPAKKFQCGTHGFSIVFPSGWEITDGEGSIVKKATAADGTYILVMVREYGAGSGKDASYMSDQELLTINDKYLSSERGKHEGLRVLDSRVSKLGNRKAGYVKFKYPDGQGQRVKSMYITFCNDRMYNLLASGMENEYARHSPEIGTAANSFAITYPGGGDLVSDVTAPASAPAQAYGAPAPEQRDTNRYYNEDAGFSILFPQGWEVKVGYMGSVVAALSPQEGTYDMYRENITIGSEQLERKISCTEYMNMGRHGLNLMVNNFQVEETSKEVIDGREAMRMVWTGSLGRIPVKQINYFMVSGKTGFVLAFTAAPDSFSRYQYLFDSVAKSFRLEGDTGFYKRM